MEKQPTVYILTNVARGPLYIDVTSNLEQRLRQHELGWSAFTRRYRLKRLVYFEQTIDMETAILREKRMKKWRRAWKIELIERSNPDWEDLWERYVRIGQKGVKGV